MIGILIMNCHMGRGMYRAAIEQYYKWKNNKHRKPLIIEGCGSFLLHHGGYAFLVWLFQTHLKRDAICTQRLANKC